MDAEQVRKPTFLDDVESWEEYWDSIYLKELEEDPPRRRLKEEKSHE
jgi:hypothetical protein